MTRSRFILFAVLGVPLLAGAHGDGHEQIAQLTVEIESAPTDGQLFLRRGELHRVHQDWKLALADFSRAEQLAPAGTKYDFQRGRTLLDAGRQLEAKEALDRAIQSQPHHVEALLARARAAARLNDPKSAAADYTRALERSRAPQPDWFVERARAQAMPGGDGTERALAGLDEAEKRLGPLAAFRETAIEIELVRKNFDGALVLLERAAARAARKESWLARRAEILAQAGRPGEARAAFESARAAIEALPPPHRTTPAMLELDQRIRAGLARLAVATAAISPGKD